MTSPGHSSGQVHCAEQVRVPELFAPQRCGSPGVHSPAAAVQPPQPDHSPLVQERVSTPAFPHRLQGRSFAPEHGMTSPGHSLGHVHCAEQVRVPELFAPQRCGSPGVHTPAAAVQPPQPDHSPLEQERVSTPAFPHRLQGRSFAPEHGMTSPGQSVGHTQLSVHRRVPELLVPHRCGSPGVHVTAGQAAGAFQFPVVPSHVARCVGAHAQSRGIGCDSAGHMHTSVGQAGKGFHWPVPALQVLVTVRPQGHICVAEPVHDWPPHAVSQRQLSPQPCVPLVPHTRVASGLHWPWFMQAPKVPQVPVLLSQARV